VSFPDHFSATAQEYARYRPRYPKALFEHLARIPPGRRLAWDCATGNGQAAVALAEQFERVVATDASARQIENAVAHPRVTYRVGPAEDSGLAQGEVDCITVAQALHWFDLDRFFAEARRVLAPGGLLAAWSYSLMTVDPQVDSIIRRYYRDVVGPYWPPERTLVEKGYTTLSFPFEEIHIPDFAMEEIWELPRMIGYLETWSATRRAREATGRDPIEQIRSELAAAWGDEKAGKLVRWPLRFRVGRTEGDVARMMETNR
jgi:ubiquinone/menaquinone biosynthesis C-methylase UbiE